jgi:PAS domain S-box-containing protein
MIPPKIIQALLISDDAKSIEQIRLFLSEADCDEIAIEASWPLSEAVERLAAGGIDLVLLDLDFRDGVGLGVLLQLRECAPGVPLIVVPGVENEELAIELLRHGAQDVLSKGDLNGRSLARAMRFALERTRSERNQQMRIIMNDLPGCIVLNEGENRPAKLGPWAAKCFKLDIIRPPRGENAMEVFGRDYANYTAANGEDGVRAGQLAVGQVIEELLPDGRICWTLGTKMPSPDSECRIIGGFIISQDMADMKSGAHGTVEMEERYRRLLDSVTDYVYTVEIQGGRVISTNHGEGCTIITGYTPAEFKAEPLLWSQIIHPDDRELVISKVQQLIQWGAPLDIEHRLIQKSGGVTWVRNKQIPHYDSRGELIACDGLISDITERKHAEELLVAVNAKLQAAVSELVKSGEDLKTTQFQLIQAEKLESIGRLAAGVAHEVKNPLAILQIGIQYFAELPLGDDETRKLVLDQMREAADRANSVIESLQNFSSSRALEIRDVPVHTLLLETLRLNRLDLVKTGIAIVTEFAPDLQTCGMDPVAIEQVLLNLIDNACHAMPSGGTLTISTGKRTLVPSEVESAEGDRSGRRLRQGQEVAVIEIHDTGMGIPEDKLPRVFDLFFTTKQTGKGKGLGLALSKRIIDLHGGQITISNALEGGSTVTILLPLTAKSFNIPSL